MKVLRAIIIDDEQKGVDALKILIERFIPEVWVVADSTEPKAAIKLIESYHPDVVFLDINMPELNGFELIENLAWKKFHLVFITAHQEHALRALKINAVDYLLKPIDQEDLKSAVERIRNKITDEPHIADIDFKRFFATLEQSPKRKIIVNSRFGMEPIESTEILVLESDSNYTKINLTDGRTILTTKCLKDYESELCEDCPNFMRVHHSFIVNLDKIARFLKGSSEIVLQSGQKVPVANSKKEKFISWLNL